ncbi:MAG: DNA-binding protein [Frankiales bacterium]|nr:DNA-binding protein [Frankiales bacterium]
MTSEVKGPPFPLRTAKAAQTRAAVITAAERLFIEHGYVSTSVQAIADAAGVSRATVFNSVGGKPALLRACYDIATVGDDDPVPLPQRPELLAVRDESDQRRTIALYAKVIAGIGERLSGTYEVFRAAATTDTEIRTQWDQIQSERLRGSQGFVRILASKGPLRRGLDREEAGDVVWAYIDASLYHRLVVECGWPRARFERWFTRSLTAYLLSPP